MYKKRPKTYKKGDLVTGKNLESDCIGIVIDEDSLIVSVKWIYHWDQELVDNTTSAFVDNLRFFNHAEF